MILKNSYEQYLRKEYEIPDDSNIVIKRGFVMSKSEALMQQEDPFKTRDLVYEDIKNETERIRNLIENANSEIDDLLRLKETAQDVDEQVYDLQIDLVVDDLFNDLSNVMRDLSKNAYQSFILRLNEDSDGETEYLYNHALLDEEIYGKINQ